MNLSYAGLRGVDLSKADMEWTTLRGVDLREAHLRWVNLLAVDLRDVDLTGANLRGVTGITNDELERQAESLRGATMPNNQKYEDWLKSKESDKNE